MPRKRERQRITSSVQVAGGDFPMSSAGSSPARRPIGEMQSPDDQDDPKRAAPAR